MALIDHPGGYRFLPGIAPYSCGAVSAPGREIVHVTFHRPPPYLLGFERLAAYLDAESLPRSALCGIELRCPEPYSFDGFADFNAGYARILEAWGLFVGAVNPVARTNVAPAVDPPEAPVLYGFSYARPCDPKAPPTFVVAGAGELPEGVLDPRAIIRAGAITSDALAEKADFVMQLMDGRLRGLGVPWADVTAADVYTVHPYHQLLPGAILDRMGASSIHGVRWFYSRPPVQGIEFEMDLRGVRVERRIH